MPCQPGGPSLRPRGFSSDELPRFGLLRCYRHHRCRSVAVLTPLVVANFSSARAGRLPSLREMTTVVDATTLLTVPTCRCLRESSSTTLASTTTTCTGEGGASSSRRTTVCACRCCCCESPDCCCCSSFMVLEPTRQIGAASSSSPASSCGGWPKGLVDSRRLASCPPGWLLFIVLAAALLRIADGCSSRSTPKPRPPQSTVRPNITFQTYTCPETYAKWYCLNGATCFSIKIGESILYNCECADGYMGQRCEFKDLDGTYLPTRQRVLIETASIAGGVTVAVVLVFIVCITVYVYYRRRKDKTYFDVPDEPKLFFCDRKKTPGQLPQPVLRQSDLERGRGVHLCDDGRRSSS